LLILYCVTMAFTGKIKQFFELKGFGFVTPDDGSEDVFVHIKDCPSLEGCQAGDACNYDIKWDDRQGKKKATNFSTTACRKVPPPCAMRHEMYRADGRKRTKKKVVYDPQHALALKRKADTAWGSKWEQW
jgi:CspA family cold shock protein